MSPPSDFLTTERLGPMQSLSPEGFLVIRNVPLARTGPQLYSDQEIPIRGDASGRVVIDREPEDVFDPATIASLNGKAVTLDHPDDDVTPDNYRDIAVGHVVNLRRGQNAQDNLLFGDLIITDPAAIKAVRDKELREVSVGYKADYEETGAGRGRQRNIVCNHLALVQDGRCGPACTIGDRAFYARDQQMDNLGPGGSQLRPFRLPRGAGAPSRDEGAGQSQGTTGSAGGGTPRKAPPPSKPPGAKAGGFTVDQTQTKSSTSQQYKHPYEPYNPNVKDQEDPDEEDLGLGQVIATLEDPGPGMTYALERQPDGSIGIVICEDDGADLSMADTTYRHSLTADAKFMKRWAGILRRRGSRTRDWASTRPTTLFRHKNLAPGERLEMQGPDEYGGYSVVLFSPTSDLTGPPVMGSKQEPNPGSMPGAQTWAAAPGTREDELDIHELVDPVRTGDRRLTEPQMLRAQNAANAAFWQRRA